MTRGRIACVVVIAALSWMMAGSAEACTCITVGKAASTDGSVMTSHTCDSHRTGSDIHVVPRAHHPEGAKLQLTKRKEDNDGAMPRYGRQPTGKIPQVAQTFGYLAPAYASMNEHQLGIGESTFGGRDELKSDKGLIDCETLTRLVLERCRTAREAVETAGALLDEHGWNDAGEVLIFTDPQEAWHMEIVGPGKDRVGAVWAARRVPDGHISVVANGARIGTLDLQDTANYLASANVTQPAQENGWWDPKGPLPFRFNHAYDPKGRRSKSVTRREWRVYDLLAPSLKLDPEATEYPFSVKPDEKVSAVRIMEVFRDTYECTDYDMVKDLVVKDEDGKAVKSPLANPFMPYDMNRMLRINGGWGWRGERPLARWYAMYVTVTQSRSWLPDPVGGIVWFGYDNPAMTTYVPLYVGITDLPNDYETDGRTTGFSREAAWWAFNRVASLAAHRWGDMRKDVAKVRDGLQAELVQHVPKVDAEAQRLLKKDERRARRYLTDYVAQACGKVVAAYWKLGDGLWTRYDEQW